MGKLLSRAVEWGRVRGATSIVTFAGLCVSGGSLYEKLGFARDKVIGPDYRYVVNGRRVHKFNYRKERFKRDPTLRWEDGATESELAQANGIPRIWDCGKIRYAYPLL